MRTDTARKIVWRQPAMLMTSHTDKERGKD